MLDIKFIRENQQIVQKAINDKGYSLDLDELLNLDKKRIDLLQKLESLRVLKNEASKKIINLSNDEKTKLLEEMKKVSTDIDKCNEEYKKIDESYSAMLSWIPQIPEEGTPVGGEEANKVIYSEGEIPKVNKGFKDHIELGKICDIIDFERGVKVMGNRGYYLKNELAQLELALMNYALDFLRERGFNQLSGPLFTKDKPFFGTGHFPFSNDEVFKAKDKDKTFNLIGTSEITLCAYYADELLKNEDLPIKFTAYSPCFRTEVGSYGKDTKGLYRVRQFYKVEQVVLLRADKEESQKYFDEILNNSKDFVRSLGIPFHILQTATKDMGAGKHKMYDIEGWMPSRESYGELGSCSEFYDWQARRSNIKYKSDNGDKKYVYTLNNTLVATPRIFIPLLELNQDDDNNIVIPQVLHKYMNGVTVIPNRSK